MTSLRPGKAVKTETDMEGAATSGESGTKRKWSRENEKETYTNISNYLFKLPSRHIDLNCNCNMNLDSTCMEMKCLKGKSIQNLNSQKLLQWFSTLESIFNI